jgi:hypothetical protein
MPTTARRASSGGSAGTAVAGIAKTATRIRPRSRQGLGGYYMDDHGTPIGAWAVSVLAVAR